MTKSFDMNMLEGRDASAAEFMFSSINQQLPSNDLSWDMVSALGLDNTNTNIGDHNFIKSIALKKNQEIVISGCPCHILHNASVKAAEAFGMPRALVSKIIASTSFIGLINLQDANSS